MRDQRPMREHHALRQAGGPTGVAEQSEIGLARHRRNDPIGVRGGQHVGGEIRRRCGVAADAAPAPAASAAACSAYWSWSATIVVMPGVGAHGDVVGHRPHRVQRGVPRTRPTSRRSASANASGRFGESMATPSAGFTPASCRAPAIRADQPAKLVVGQRRTVGGDEGDPFRMVLERARDQVDEGRDGDRGRSPLLSLLPPRLSLGSAAAPPRTRRGCATTPYMNCPSGSVARTSANRLHRRVLRRVVVDEARHPPGGRTPRCRRGTARSPRPRRR